MQKGLIYFGIVIVLGICSAAFRKPSAASIDAQLAREAREENAQCPKMIGENLRLDKVGSGHLLATFEYTWIDLSDEEIAVAGPIFEKEFRNDPDCKSMLKGGISVTMTFHNEDGKQTSQFTMR